MPRKRTPKATEQRAPETNVPLAVVGRGGRRTRDAAGNLGLFGPRAIVPPKDPAGDWRALDLSARTLSRISTTELADYLADLSPEVSKALFDLLRECNPGYELTAYRPGTETVDETAQAALDAFVSMLDDRQDGIFDVTIGRMFLAMFLRGAFLAELVLDAQGRMPLELVTPDPWLFRFRRAPAPELGEKATRNVLCQWQDGKLADLDSPLVRYIPIDPLPGSPYGRPLVAPALFVCLFMLAVMHDLRRVVQNQAYPRNRVKISLEEIIKAAPQLASNWATLNAEATKAKDAVEAYIPTLEPDDTFIYTSMLDVLEPVGAGGSGKLEGILQTIDWLERMAVRALKTTPFQMAMSQSQTETQANRQFESRMLGIRTLQHYAETPLSRLFTLMLQAQGIVADVKMRFEVNRASERMRDAQTDTIEIANARARYDHGWISHEQAAMEGAGVEVPDADEPRQSAPSTGLDPSMQENPEPGASRAAPPPGATLNREAVARRDRRAKLVPLGADEPFEELTPLDPLTEDERAALAGVWDRSHTGSNGRYKGLLEAEVVTENDDA